MKFFNKRTPEDIVRRNLDTGNRINLGPNREYLIGSGSTENSFLERDIFTAWCDDLSEEELWGISASTALSKDRN
mgnify:CR=1 FL=1